MQTEGTSPHPLEAACKATRPNSGQQNVIRFVGEGTNCVDPSEEVKKPKDWHRAAAVMFINGQPLGAVADAFETSIEHIKLLYKEKHFQEVVKSISLEKEGSFKTLLKGMGMDALIQLHLLAVGGKTENARAGASKTLVECLWGKPLPGKGLLMRDAELDPEEEMRLLEEEAKLYEGNARTD